MLAEAITPGETKTWFVLVPDTYGRRISNTIILVVLICLLGLLYLTQVTKTNAYGYQINSLQQEQTQLQTENNNLELTSAQLQSQTRVPSSQVANTLVPVTPSGTVQQ